MSVTKVNTKNYLHPDVISKISNLEIIAKMIVEGFMIGLHKSPFHGFSVEFSQHRPYNPGDTLKYIDWKIYGRTDRFYIKQFEEETNLRATILLDISNSMAFRSNTITKLDYAKYITAALSFLILQQRDAIGLATFDNKIQKYLNPRSVSSYLKPILNELENAKSGNDTNISPVLHEIAERLNKRGLIILISDLLDEPEKIISSVKHFRHNKHEVIVFHILDPMEISFSFEGEIQFEDLENNQSLKTFPWYIRNEYKKEIQEFIDYFNKKFLENQVDYHLIDTAMTFDKALLEYLVKRKRLN